jgi:hypothetical protein
MRSLGRLLALTLVLPFFLLVAPAADAGPPIGLQEPYLLGRTVYLPASNSHVTLAVPRSHRGHLELLGPAAAGKGWVVVDWAQAPTIKVLVATARRTRTIRTFVDEVNSTWYRLSNDKKQVVELWADPYGNYVKAVAVDLKGMVLEKRRFRGYGEVLDLDDGQAVVSTDAGTFLWTIGGTSEKIAGPSEAASLSAGVLFVQTSTGVGPTDLEEPGEPAWTDPDFSARAISSDGRMVLGLHGRKLEVRHVKTSEVNSVLDTKYRAGDPLLWKNGSIAKRIMVTTHKEGRTALMLCKITTGSCHRETDWLRGWLTLSFQTHYFGESV